MDTRPGKRWQKNDGKIHHAIYGKTHYFDWAIFNSELLNYQRVSDILIPICCFIVTYIVEILDILNFA